MDGWDESNYILHNNSLNSKTSLSPLKTNQLLASCCEEMGGGCMHCCSQASAWNESVELESVHGKETTNQRNGLF